MRLLVNSRIKKIIDNFTPLDNKDELKFKHIIDKKNLKSISENHLKAINEDNELTKCSWIAEQEHTLWLDPKILTYFLIYMDLVGTTPSGNVGEQIYIGEIKNVLGTLTKTKKGFSYSNKKAPVIPHHSHLMQISLYCECIPGSKPFISYASNCDYKLFTEDNCDELKPENRKKYIQQLKVYQLSWQKKLEIADGDINKLALLVPPDYSEIRKKSIWWNGVPKEYMERYLNYYQC